jgi:hypothetical protein
VSDYSSLFSSTEQKYGLPPGILAATAQVESSLNPRAVSPKGAQGLMQLLPSTAKNLGANPMDVPQAVDAAGRLWQQNLQASGGDLDRAAMMYHGGTDPRNWGPKTAAYPGKIVAALEQRQPRASDPVEAALSGGGQSAPGGDPVENALIGGNAAHVPSGPLGHPAGNAGDQGNLPADRGPDNGAGRDAGGDQQGNQRRGAGGPPGGLQPHSVTLGDLAQAVGGTADAAVNGFTAGLIKPFNAVIDSFIPNAVAGQKTATVFDGSSLSDAFHHNLALERQQVDQFRSDHPVASIASDLTGAIASPFNKILAPGEGAGFLRSIPNFMAQGAIYGGVRGGADTGTAAGAGEGAAIGAGLAPVAAGAANVGGKLLGAALRARSTLANAIPQTERQAAAAMIDKGASTAEVVAEHPNLDPNYVEKWIQYRANGGKAPVQFRDAPPDTEAPAPQQYAAALGSQGSRRGVEAVSDLPPQVQSDVQRLTQAGVPAQEAQREADILYVGGKPTVAAVTRDPGEQWAFNEGAKDASTDAGRLLNDTQAANNQALHNTLNQTVDNFGGIPAQGEAAQSSAEALADASDAARAKVSDLYKQARATDGDVRINTDQLRELLQSPEMQTPTNPAVQQLANGIAAHLKAVDQRAGTTLRTPEEIEQIRQLANSAFDPMGGPVNGAVGKIGAALNDSLDQLDTASAAYKVARAAHRDWASQYSDPAGVARLIARDAQGNFLNADQWRLSENGLIDRLNDKPFAQVVTQLQKIGASDALNKLKAGIVQRAYERATSSARDKLGNPVVNGKLFQQELNKIGLPKLQALFSPDELAHLATVGRAARALNEPVPGTINHSNTSAAINHTQSSLAAALKSKPGTHPLLKALRATKYVSAGAGHLHAAVVLHGAEHLSTGAADRAIGQGVREQLNPGLARAAAARSQARIGNAQQRAAIGRALRNRGAVPAADNDRGKALGRKLKSAL